MSFITPQASSLREASFHRMAAKPSGERTEYTAFSSMSTRLPTPRARAPPLPPSPVTTETTGTVRRLDRARVRAMASRLAPGLGLQAGVGAGGVDKGDDGAAELLRLKHEPLGLAVALW